MIGPSNILVTTMFVSMTVTAPGWTQPYPYADPDPYPYPSP